MSATKDIAGKHRIEVTAEDIAKGKREDCEACPIAQALMRCLPIATVEVEGGRSGVGVMEAGTEYRYHATLPDAADRFVEEFDRGEPVGPFAFDLTFHAEEP